MAPHRNSPAFRQNGSRILEIPKLQRVGTLQVRELCLGVSDSVEMSKFRFQKAEQLGKCAARSPRTCSSSSRVNAARDVDIMKGIYFLWKRHIEKNASGKEVGHEMPGKCTEVGQKIPGKRTEKCLEVGRELALSWGLEWYFCRKRLKGRSEKTEVARPEKETTKKEKGRERAGVRILRG